MRYTNMPMATAKFELQAYKKPSGLRELKKTHVPFTGSPQQHPYDGEKLILVSDPYSSNPIYLEFNTGDISYAEELSNIVDLDGNTVHMARIWVKKGCLAMQCSIFVVEDTRRRTPD